MAKKLPLDSDWSIDDLVINWEDDIYLKFPFLKLKENGLCMKPVSDLTVIKDNMVRGLSCLLYTSPSPRDGLLSRMPSSA